jgi:hypothetical protein
MPVSDAYYWLACVSSGGVVDLQSLESLHSGSSFLFSVFSLKGVPGLPDYRHLAP